MAAQRTSAEIVGCAIFELDTNGDADYVWGFPGLSDEAQEVVLARSGLRRDVALKQGQSTPTGFVYSRFQGAWHYSYAVSTSSAEEKGPGTSEASSAKLSQVGAFAVSVTATTFNPEKFGSLTAALASVYRDSGTPPAVLSSYLEASTQGRLAVPREGREDLHWRSDAFDDRKALITNSSLRTLLAQFGPESVVLWVAMMLKKRVVVIGSNPTQVMRTVRTMPQLVWHRMDWSLCFPFVTSSEPELAELRSAGVFVAGVGDPSFRTLDSTTFDLMVDLDSGSLSIADKARKAFGMGKLHKRVAGVLGSQGEASGDQAAIKAIAKETIGVLKPLRDLAAQGGGSISPDALKQLCEEKQLRSSEARFMQNLAQAERLLAAN